MRTARQTARRKREPLSPQPPSSRPGRDQSAHQLIVARYHGLEAELGRPFPVERAQPPALVGRREQGGKTLGESRLLSPIVMVNLLGDVWQKGEPAWNAIFGAPEAKLHLYGKRDARPGRKMGHFTVLGDDPDAALERALAIRSRLSPDFHLQPA